MHTAGLAQFLARAGYEVKHFFARYLAWGIGRVTDELISPSEALEFDEASWNDETAAGSAAACRAVQPGNVVTVFYFPGSAGSSRSLLNMR